MVNGLEHGNQKHPRTTSGSCVALICSIYLWNKCADLRCRTQFTHTHRQGRHKNLSWHFRCANAQINENCKIIGLARIWLCCAAIYCLWSPDHLILLLSGIHRCRTHNTLIRESKRALLCSGAFFSYRSIGHGFNRHFPKLGRFYHIQCNAL